MSIHEKALQLAAREARLRRLAYRHGLQLLKSRARNPDAPDYGTYALIDLTTNCLVVGDGQVCNGFGLDLDDVTDLLVALGEPAADG